MSRPRMDLIGLGECMLELRAEGALGSAAMLARGYGGDVLNALVTAARLGGRTGFITRVGNDPFGASLRESWRAEGIDLHCAPLVEGENGVYFIALSADGEREFTYRRQGSAASRITPAHLDEEYIAAASCLLVSGITQAISASAQAATLAACQMARRHGVTVAYDPNYRERLWAARGGLAGARAALREVLAWTDILLPSYPCDAALLENGCVGAAEAAQGFHAFGPEVAQKCGGIGSGVVVDGAWLPVAPAAAARVVDTTGAGDAWNGAYLLQRTKEKASLPAAAAVANRVAAAKLAHRGAIPAKTNPTH